MGLFLQPPMVRLPMSAAAALPLEVDEIPQWYKDNEKRTPNGAGKVMINRDQQHPQYYLDAKANYERVVNETKATYGADYNLYNWEYVPETSFRPEAKPKTQDQLNKQEENLNKYRATQATKTWDAENNPNSNCSSNNRCLPPPPPPRANGSVPPLDQKWHSVMVEKKHPQVEQVEEEQQSDNE